MTHGRRPYVAVLYNFVGEDEYEVLAQKVREGTIESPTGAVSDLAGIATLDNEIQALVDGLEREGFEARAVNVKDRFDRLLEALTRPPPDVVFNLIEYFNDDSYQEHQVAGLYDLLRVPFTGSASLTLAICQRKGLTKQILMAHDLPTPRFRQVRKEPIPKLYGLRYPLIVKPAWGDASEGVEQEAVVSNRAELEERVRLVHRSFSHPALIEEYIAGRELGVSVIGNSPPRVLPIEEMDFGKLPPDQHAIISYQAKWDPLHESFHRGALVCPAVLRPAVARRVTEIALRAYHVLGCRDYARVDIRLDARGRPYILEVNPNPDLTAGVAFMASAEAAGMTFSGTLRFIVEEALRRGARTPPPAAGQPPGGAGGA